MAITPMFNATGRIIGEVIDERIRQDAKRGEQNHIPVVWMAILGEEVGEANRAALEALAPCGNPIGNKLDWLRNYRDELIQVAAVAVAAIESLDRNEMKGE